MFSSSLAKDSIFNSRSTVSLSKRTKPPLLGANVNSSFHQAIYIPQHGDYKQACFHLLANILHIRPAFNQELLKNPKQFSSKSRSASGGLPRPISPVFRPPCARGKRCWYGDYVGEAGCCFDVLVRQTKPSLATFSFSTSSDTSRQSRCCNLCELILPLHSFIFTFLPRWFLLLLSSPLLALSLLVPSCGTVVRTTMPTARSLTSGRGLARSDLINGTFTVSLAVRALFLSITDSHDQALVPPTPTSTLTPTPRTRPTQALSKASRSPTTRPSHGTARPCFAPN